MAGPILSAVGGALGGPIGSFVGLMFGKWIDNKVLGLGPADIKQEGPRLENLLVQVSSYSAPIPRLYGTMRLAGNVIWARPIREQKLTDEISGGCFGPDTTIVKYNYYGTFAIGLCQGPIDAILRIWADTKLVYDNSTINHDVVQIPRLSYRVYLGDETQTADPTMEHFEGVGNVPGYRGLAYVVFNDLHLAEFGNRIPNMSFEITTNAGSSQPFDEFPELSLASFNQDDFRVEAPAGLFAVLHTSGIWTRLNLREGTIVKTVNNGDVGNPNAGFDYGGTDFIYTSAPGVAFDTDAIHKLIARSFSVMNLGADIPQGMKQVTYGSPPRQIGSQVSTASGVIFALSTSGLKFYLFTDHLAEPYLTYILPADGHMIAVRRGEIAYVVCSDGGSPGTTYVVRFDGNIPLTFNVTAYILNGERICFDVTTNQIIVFSGSTQSLSFFDADTMAHIVTMSGIVGVYNVSEFRRGVVDGYLWIGGQSLLYKIDVAAHTIAATYTLPFIKSAGGFYDSLMNSYWYGSNAVSPSGGFVRLFLNRLIGNGVPLSDVVTDLCGQLGLVPSEIDVTALTDTVKGFCIDNRMSGRAAIEALMAAYFFDACESDGKIKFPKRLGSSIASIPETELGAHLADSSRPQTFIKSRTELWETPRIIEIEYLDALLINERVVAFGLNTPPGAPTLGDVYVVGTSPTGAWVGYGNQLAYWTAGGWVFVVPLEGWRIFDEGLLVNYVFDGSLWERNSAASTYRIGLQRASRQTVDSDLVVTVRLPLVMDSQEAARVAEKHLKLAWIARNASEVAVGRKHIKLDPTDIITVTAQGTEHRLRIVQIKNAGGVLQLSCVDDDVAAYSSSAVGITLPDEPGGVDWQGPTEYEMIDCPLLSDSTNTPGVYIAATGVTTNWKGATMYRSNDGSSWTILIRVVNDGVIGSSTNLLADVADPNVWDEGNSINVFLQDTIDSLISATEAEVLNGANVGILGDEIIQWQNAVAQANGSFTLSRLLRARKGTEYATGTHSIGDRFAILEASKIHFTPLGVSDKNVERFYLSVSLGTAFDSGLEQAFTCQIRNMMPLSPVHIEGSRDGSNNLTITWVRRTRIAGDWVDAVDVPLGETVEAYECDILDGPAGAVLRTITGLSTTSASYTAAQQTADGGTPGNPVTVVVYQISTVVGRGFGAEETI